MGFFDTKRNLFLAAMLGEDWKAAENIYKDIASKVDSSFYLSEADQKAVNQIQHAFKTLGGRIPVSYIDKMRCFNRLVRKKLAIIVRKSINAPSYIEFDKWRRSLMLDKQRFNIMLSNVTNLQITSGCNNFCRRCNEWALPGARKHFSFSAVKILINRLFEAGNPDFLLYGASDPLDWRWRDRTLFDIIKFMNQKGYKTKYGILTKIPGGTEPVFEKLLYMDVDIGVSVTKKNKDKVNKIIKKTGKQIDVHHDVEELAISSGLDEDFLSIKSSITDNYGTEITPDGAFLIIPAFTSSLNLTGQYKIPVTEKTDFFIKKRVGLDALSVEYFKPVTAINKEGEEFVSGSLLDAQIQNIMIDSGSEEIAPPGIMNFGQYLKTYEHDAVLQRKKLFISVLKGFKKDVLQNSCGSENSKRNQYDLFRRKVNSYLEHCDITTSLYNKKIVFSYYLKAISEYLKKHEAERQIVLRLRKKDLDYYKEKYKSFFSKSIKDVDLFLDRSDIGTFVQFQVIMFMLLSNPDDVNVKKFIYKYPSRYVAELDSFERA